MVADSAYTPIVLIVDDEPINVEILADLLSRDYRVKVVSDGKTALRIAGASPQPDLILLDIMMPEMDGFEVLNNLQAHDRTRDIPVIFITAALDFQSEKQGLELGAVDYLTKPINRVTTLLRVKNHLAFRQSQRCLAQREAFLRALVDNAPHAVWVMSADGQWLLLNKFAQTLLGYRDLPQANARPALEFVHPDYRAGYEQFHNRVLAGGSARFELALNTQAAPVHWLEVSLAPFSDEQGRITATLAIASDITQRKQAEAKLRLFAKVFENIQEGIVVMDLRGQVQDVNPAFCRITGYARDEAPGLLQANLQPPEQVEQLWQALQQTGCWQGEIWNRKKSGELYPEWLSIAGISDDHGQIEHYLAVLMDITRLKQQERQLERIAHYDALTGIPNRILLGDRLRQAVAQSRREQNQLAVCYLDLDGFKPINDELGHEAGDRVLVECARRMVGVVREMDTVARLGGDEFVILLQGLDDGWDSTTVLDRLLAAIAEPLYLDGKICEVSASIGVAVFPVDGDEPDSLLRHADQSMYIAKQSGKNRYHFFDADQDGRLRHFSESMLRIGLALQQQEFVLFYQPKLDLKTGRVIGAEALIRWQHPERGLLAPMEFLPFIQHTELEAGLGEWVIETALAQLDDWRLQGLAMQLSINISANHLQAENFITGLHAKLACYPAFDRDTLQIEILETAALEDFSKVSTIIAACQQLGVSFALDDFGTGYSSLTYLRNLPADTIKIDQTFVRDMLDDPGDFAIIQSIIALANTFSREIVAEGVETLAHLHRLAEMGCHSAQGYGIAEPMPSAEFVAWCKQHAIDPLRFLSSGNTAAD